MYWLEAKAIRIKVELESELEKSKYAKLQVVAWSAGTSRHVPKPPLKTEKFSSRFGGLNGRHTGTRVRIPVPSPRTGTSTRVLVSQAPDSTCRVGKLELNGGFSRG